MLIRGYAVLAYAAFLSSIGWAIYFLTGPVDGPATSSTATALAIDGALLLLFAVHHSVAARAGFKERLTRLIPPAAERSTFVLTASLLLFALLAGWQPVPAVIWDGPDLLWVLYAAGWLLAVASTYMIDHADFAGLKQAFRPAHREPEFSQRWLYRWLRHPMMAGLAIAFWATPHLSAGHLFLAVASTGYILVGVHFEERDLRARFPEHAEVWRR